MRKLSLLIALSYLSCLAPARSTRSTRSAEDVAPARAAPGAPLAWLTQPKDYRSMRSSSFDRTGGNADFLHLAPKEVATLLDASGPGVVSHLWMTIASPDPAHLSTLVLRMYWDGEGSPSVEAPVGAFFGLGLGQYVDYESTPLAVAPAKALNAFFPMPFRGHARITVSNEGASPVDALYFNVDYSALRGDLPADTLYFHAQYRQASPASAALNDGTNLTGADNYVFLEAQGRGHFVGVTLSVIQSEDGWWGEGDDMFFVDGEVLPTINGTGSEDYFLGAWDFGGKPFAYASFGAPVVGAERAGERWSVYRFHLDAPITFEQSLRATIEHGHANGRADDYASVAYWYQTEPHAPFPPLPDLPRRMAVRRRQRS
jgi:hypothetical protein